MGTLQPNVLLPLHDIDQDHEPRIDWGELADGMEAIERAAGREHMFECARCQSRDIREAGRNRIVCGGCRAVWNGREWVE